MSSWHREKSITFRLPTQVHLLMLLYFFFQIIKLLLKFLFNMEYTEVNPLSYAKNSFVIF